MLSGLAVMSPVMGDAVSVELSVTAEVTENVQYLADCGLISYPPMVCLASFSNFTFFLLMAVLINSI